MNDYQRVIAEKGVLSFTPGGISMWPFILNGKDTCIIEAVKTPPKKYDVVFYRRESGQYVLHRIMKITPDGYDMCGDSQTAVEKNIRREAVFGIMSAYYRKGKYIDCKKNLLYLAAVRIWSVSIFMRRVFLKCLRMVGVKPR